MESGSDRFTFTFYFFTTVLSQCDFSHGNSGCLPWGKLAATESRYPTYRACRVFYCFHNPPNSDTDLYRAHRCKCMRLHTGVYGHRKRVCTESWLWEKNPLLAPGNRTCVGSVPVRCSTNWATFPSITHWLFINRTMIFEKKSFQGFLLKRMKSSWVTNISYWVKLVRACGKLVH